MKNKVVIKSKKDVHKWIEISNLFAKSLCEYNIALNQYDKLTQYERYSIKRQFQKCDEVRRNKIPSGEGDDWIIGIMVDAHLLANDYNVDPLTIVMCMNPLSKPNEKILVK